MPQKAAAKRRSPTAANPGAPSPERGSRAKVDIAHLLQRAHGKHVSTRALLLAQLIREKYLDWGDGEWDAGDMIEALDRLVAMLDSLDNRRARVDPSLGGMVR